MEFPGLHRMRWVSAFLVKVRARFLLASEAGPKGLPSAFIILFYQSLNGRRWYTKMYRHSVIFLPFPLLFLFVAIGLSTNASGNDSEINVIRLEQGAIIDGKLDDEAWKSAAVVSGFGQVEPVSGAAPSEHTVMRVFSTASALYIGVRCFDSEPGKMLARDRRRDSPGRGDDRVRMVFDTFEQAKNGYYFAVAGGGGKADGVVRSGGRPDLTWDTIWSVETSQDDEGWVAEFEIPFRSLAFDVNRTSWGFNVEREIRRKHEKLRWVSPTRLRSMWTLQGLGKLTGLKDLDMGFIIQIISIQPRQAPTVEDVMELL